MTFEIEEEERQLLVVALAVTAVLRPGFKYACTEAAKTLQGEPMFHEMVRFNTPPRNYTGANIPPEPLPPNT